MSRSLPTTGSGIITSFEMLEPRRLLSTTINYAYFGVTHGLVFNGYGAKPTTDNLQLVLTDGAEHEAHTVYYNTAAGIQTFQTKFAFQIGAGPRTADGFTFVLQNVGLQVVGGDGSGLGFAGLGHSFGVSFDLYNFDDNTFESDFRFLINGAGTTSVAPIAMAPVNLHSGDIMVATVSYNGSTVSVHVVDQTLGTSFSASDAINLHSLLGGWTAFAGFTGATGGAVSDQNILNWTYTGTAPVLAPPTVQIPAAASPDVVNNFSTDLSVLGESADGNFSVTYTWSTLQAPFGAKPVVFSDNGENAASNITVTFSHQDIYVFQCEITDINGQSTTSDVTVRVNY